MILVDGVAVPIVGADGRVISRPDRPLVDVIQECDALGRWWRDRMLEVRSQVETWNPAGSVKR
jgi:hypothetical protein